MGTEGYYQVYNNAPLVRILNHTNLVQILISYSFKINVYSILHLYLGLPSGQFPWNFPIALVYAFLNSTVRAACPSHFTLHDFITLIICLLIFKHNYVVL
jgi:hypothetical protein